VLEHASPHGSPLEATLAEWHRVLAPGGALLVAVPDLRAVAAAYASDDVGLDDRARLGRVLYGGQATRADYHHVGFDAESLARTLEAAGFCDVARVRSFGLFNDTTLVAFRGAPLSLNVQARACGKRGARVAVDVPATPWDAP